MSSSAKQLFRELESNPISDYVDRQFAGTVDEQMQKLKHSTTLYVGNLSFNTTENQLYEFFSRAGRVKRVIMGLNNVTKLPCGFCFVEYFTRPDAERAMTYLKGARLDDRPVRTDWDAGFVEGRQFGRGRSGGQVRDEYRVEYDAGRGGFGRLDEDLDMEPPSPPRATKRARTDAPEPDDSTNTPNTPTTTTRFRRGEDNSDDSDSDDDM